MTSIAVQPATAIGMSSAGRMPVSPWLSSRTISCPLPERATNRRSPPSSVMDAVLMAIGGLRCF